MNFFKNLWGLIMNPNVNPLSNITNLKIRHMIMQILAFMWSGVFSIYIVDSLYVFGITAIAHALLIAAIVITAYVFYTAKNKPQVFDGKSGKQ
jgi:hypothetical protein